jgi:hypothetical protein
MMRRNFARGALVLVLASSGCDGGGGQRTANEMTATPTGAIDQTPTAVTEIPTPTLVATRTPGARTSTPTPIEPTAGTRTTTPTPTAPPDATEEPSTPSVKLCGASPQPGCRRAQDTVIVLRRGRRVPRNQLSWRWRKGESTALEGFGNPVAGRTGYALCVYGTTAGTPSLMMSLAAEGGGLCGNASCWQRIGARGFRYRDRLHLADGIHRILLRTGTAGRARIVFKAKGDKLPLPTPAAGKNLVSQDPTATVQLVNSEGQCWSAEYQAPAKRSNSTVFKDK